MDLTLVHSADLSPGGTAVAWCVSRTDADEERLGLRLSRVGVPGHTAVGNGPRDHDPAWSPDGVRLAYLSDRDDRSELVLAEVASLRCEPMMPSDRPELSLVSGPLWSPDGRLIAYTATESTREPARPYRVTRAVPWVDGLGLADDAAADIYVVEVATGQHRRLTRDGWLNHDGAWLADSSGLVFLASNGPDDWQGRSEVRTVDLDGRLVDLAPAGDYFSVAVTPVGVAVTTLAEGPRDTARLTVLEADGRTSERAEALGLDINGDVLGDIAVPFVNPDPRLLIAGEDAVVRVQVQDRLEIHRVALSGEPRNERLLSGPACYYPLAIADARLLYAMGTITAPPELWVLDLDTGHRVQVSDTTNENAGLCSDVNVSDFWVQAPGGPSVQAKFLRRADLGGPLPTVLLIHGGPKSAFGQVFFTDAQLLCEAGFGVLLVNPRGSRGYGVEFADAITGDWGNLDYQDLLVAVEAATAQGLTDPDRLGVAGLSYGGYLSSWMIAHTSRFRAAVIENPVTNLWSLYGTSDIGLSFGPEITGDTPHNALDRYVRCSPLTTAHTCTTPTLLIQAEQDHRCPPEQSMQFYSALKGSGCTVEMLMLPDASHDGSISGPVAGRRAQNEALVDWMVRHLLD
ncbi:MAG: S9 family peptidase [Jatrophihabitantaceae bacterium]